MCGIVAVFRYGQAARPTTVDDVVAMRDAMAHRGPDAAGIWMSADGRIALGHRRLSIIDLSPAGNQPMFLGDSETCITFNGEIYNYRELRHELEQRGRVFRTTSDTEVLLHAYEEFGPEMVGRLRGMFAFAIWDHRRRGLFLARDPFGIKPLYYADDGELIATASQVKALKVRGRFGRELSPAGVVCFLLWGSILEPRTLYKDIHALPAGSWMWVDEQGARPPRRYWSVGSVFEKATAARPEAGFGRNNRANAREELREALLESIRYHMVADVPVGVFLSGGLDSGTLVSLAAELMPGNLQTLTLGFDELRGTPADEVAVAEQVAKACNTVHQSSWIGRVEFEREHERLLAAMDQPTIDGVNVYFVSQLAASRGLKVALSGLGGDELFGGYPSFEQVPRIVRRLHLFGAMPAFGRGFRRVSGPLLARLTSPKYAGLFEYGTSFEDAYFLRRGLFMPWELPEVLDADFAKEGWAQLDQGSVLRDCTAGVADDRARVAALEMSIYMRNQLLRDSDWAGMAHSLEIRVPYVDAFLLERLAPLLMGPTALGKKELVDTLRTALPSDALSREKSGFTVPVRDWLMKSSPEVRGRAERGLRSWARHILIKQGAVGALGRDWVKA